jgi:hypothetical protein
VEKRAQTAQKKDLSPKKDSFCVLKNLSRNFSFFHQPTTRLFWKAPWNDDAWKLKHCKAWKDQDRPFPQSQKSGKKEKDFWRKVRVKLETF